MYKIMNKDLTAYSSSGWDCPKRYEEDKLAHLNDRDARYGDVLVLLKRVKVGYDIKIRFYFRSHWYWKPIFSKYGGYFHWLNIMIWANATYDDIKDKVEKDHLTEFLNC